MQPPYRFTQPSSNKTPLSAAGSYSSTPAPSVAAPSQLSPIRRVAAAPPRWGVVFVTVLLLVFNHLGRPFEKVLVGYKIPAILCGTAVLLTIFTGAFRNFNNRTGRPFLLYLLWLTLTMPFSSWKGGSTVDFVWFALIWPVMFLLLGGAKSFFEVRALSYMVLFSCLFHMLLGSQMLYGRLALQGTFGNSDDVALLAGFALVFLIFVATRFPLVLTLILLASVGGYLLRSIGLTGTRAAIPALACAIGIYLIRSSMLQRVVIVLCGGIAAMILVVTLPDSILTRLATISDALNPDAVVAGTDEASDSLLQRRELLRDGVKMTLTHPVFGVGFGQFAEYRGEHMRGANGAQKVYYPAHNTYLQISAETGIPGILLYLTVLAMTYVTINKARKLNFPNAHPDWKSGYALAVCLEAGLVYFVICAMFMTCDRHPQLFILAGLALALERVSKAAVEENARRAPQPASSPVAKTAFPFLRPIVNPPTGSRA